ncbi:transcriptional regulator FeaR [Halomonas janggokensis]|uniref:Transcriptional regulator FeaR n=1 Tax=Vreelandella janggokensis TaxID=370767 RepID=A0ABT4IV89_9GAMM|nr:transcriptional regulator FeaR [Halomonas janggokensis]MCZ0927588.1 transcriptional regulator FeaR [Halomonas janggokensis]MCZ0930096.1 transcriptional regulator FeaR [Halomonas janggokensis]
MLHTTSTPTPATSATSMPFDAWLGALRQTCGHFDCTPRDRRSFQGSVSTRTNGGIDIANIVTNAEKVTSSRAQRRDEDRYCFLVVQKQGRATLVQNDTAIVLRPGEMALMDSIEACDVIPHGLIEHDSLHLSRREVAQRFGETSIPFMKITADCASSQILQLVVNRMVTEPLASAEQGEEGVSDSLVALLPTIYRHQALSPSFMEQADGTLFNCVQQFIDQHLHEDELGPERLALAFHMSVRQLYRLFEQHGETVCRYVQRRRLARCAEELASPILIKRSITQIAYKWGFTDSAHFSRAFKREFASSPREYRRAYLARAA